MRTVEAWAASADPSLVRHWVFAVLAAVAPPYSAAFASSLIRRALLLLLIAKIPPSKSHLPHEQHPF
jgi:hypothetical protein